MAAIAVMLDEVEPEEALAAVQAPDRWKRASRLEAVGVVGTLRSPMDRPLARI